jgi:hypothetical protein
MNAESKPPRFGLDKPHDHYYGAGKCDLLTYDCEDGFGIDVNPDGSDDLVKGASVQKKITVVTPPPTAATPLPSKSFKVEPKAPVVVIVPPSQCFLVNQSLARACMEGKLVNTASTLERTVASAILSFCLSNHPEDAGIAKKIALHLEKGPMLANEFEMYCRAMSPGSAKLFGSDDLARDWKMFTSNFMKRVALGGHRKHEFTATENQVMERVVASWFEAI